MSTRNLTWKFLGDIRDLKGKVTEMGVTFKKFTGDVTGGMKGATNAFHGMRSGAFGFQQVNMAAQQLIGVMGGMARPFIELDKQVKNIGTLGVKGFEEFTDMALQASKEIPNSASEIAQGVYDAVSAGVTGTNQEIMEFVKTAGKVGVAGLTSTQEAVNGLTSVTNAYKLGAAGAEQVSNEFFAAIKLGKTTFPELNASMATAVPTAAALGIKFQEVLAMTANMTAQGVPTAQAFTQIRGAMVGLQKPVPALKKVYTALGWTMNDLRDKLSKDGLTATLQEVQVQAKKMGLAATDVFGRVEAASAYLLTTGDNAEIMNAKLAAMRAEVEGGVATEAYEVAAQGLDVKIKTMVNSIQATFAKFFQAAGAEATAVVGVADQMAPTVSAMVALGPSVGKMGKTIASTLVPSIVSLDAATGKASISAKGLGKAMMSPLVIVPALVAAISALRAALDTTEKEKMDNIKADGEMIKSEREHVVQMKAQAEAGKALAEQYVKLGEKANRTKGEEEAMKQIETQLREQYPGIIRHTDDFATKLEKVKNQAKKSASELRDFGDSIDELDRKYAKNQFEELNQEVWKSFEELEDKMTDEQGVPGLTALVESLTGGSEVRYQVQEFNQTFKDAIGQAGKSALANYQAQVKAMREQVKGGTMTQEAFDAERGTLLAESQAAAAKEVDLAYNDFYDKVQESIAGGDMKKKTGAAFKAAARTIKEQRIKYLNARILGVEGFLKNQAAAAAGDIDPDPEATPDAPKDDGKAKAIAQARIEAEYKAQVALAQARKAGAHELLAITLWRLQEERKLTEVGSADRIKVDGEIYKTQIEMNMAFQAESYKIDQAARQREFQAEQLRLQESGATDDEKLESKVRYTEDLIDLAAKYDKTDEEIMNLQLQRSQILSEARIAAQRRVDEDYRAIAESRVRTLQATRGEELAAIHAEHNLKMELLQKEFEAGKISAELLAARQEELNADRAAKEEALTEARVRSEVSAANNILDAMSSVFAESFEASKAVSMVRATISAYEAYNTALSAFPPPWSFIAAGAQLAAGLVNVRNIAAQQPPKRMAYGGVVMQRQKFAQEGGGGLYEVGEVNPEAIIPLKQIGDVYDRLYGNGPKKNTTLIPSNMTPVDDRMKVDAQANVTIDALDKGLRAVDLERSKFEA